MVPEIFKIGNFSVSGYVFFYVLVIIITSLFIFFKAKREKFDPLEIINFLIFGIIAMFLGTKIYGVIYTYITQPSSHLNLGEIFTNIFSGGVFYGGIIAGLIFVFFYLPAFFKGREWELLDIVAVGGALGQIFGRIGCFMAGCCYGKITDLPWAVQFRHLGDRVHPFAGHYVHPAQLYHAFLNLLNFIFLYFCYRKRKFQGQIFSLYLINYGLIRIVVEMFRNDGGRGYLFKGDNLFFNPSIPQVISLFVILLGIVLFNKNKKNREDPV
jgi:phosphatidylglycerol:prolipoprotein diacylglycerol transferase